MADKKKIINIIPCLLLNILLSPFLIIRGFIAGIVFYVGAIKIDTGIQKDITGSDVELRYFARGMFMLSVLVSVISCICVRFLSAFNFAFIAIQVMAFVVLYTLTEKEFTAEDVKETIWACIGDSMFLCVLSTSMLTSVITMLVWKVS